ncbi:MAG: hypothetical protein ACLFQB_04055 [Chitinispirillaceae bacterium]
MKIRLSGRQAELSVFRKGQDTAFEPTCVTTVPASTLKPVSIKAAQISMKGGFVGTGAQRRMVIVGKIGKF